MPIKKKTVKLSKLKPNSFNPKRTERFQDETRRLKTSLDKFGQVLPVLVREVSGELEILNGYHRYKALIEKGDEEVEVWNVGEIPDSTAKAIVLSLEDSRIPLNRLKVAHLVNSMVKRDFLPYSPSQNALEVLLLFSLLLPFRGASALGLRDTCATDPFSL